MKCLKLEPHSKHSRTDIKCYLGSQGTVECTNIENQEKPSSLGIGVLGVHRHWRGVFWPPVVRAAINRWEIRRAKTTCKLQVCGWLASPLHNTEVLGKKGTKVQRAPWVYSDAQAEDETFLPLVKTSKYFFLLMKHRLKSFRTSSTFFHDNLANCSYKYSVPTAVFASFTPIM